MHFIILFIIESFTNISFYVKIPRLFYLTLRFYDYFILSHSGLEIKVKIRTISWDGREVNIPYHPISFRPVAEGGV